MARAQLYTRSLFVRTRRRKSEDGKLYHRGPSIFPCRCFSIPPRLLLFLFPFYFVLPLFPVPSFPVSTCFECFICFAVSLPDNDSRGKESSKYVATHCYEKTSGHSYCFANRIDSTRLRNGFIVLSSI